MPIFWGGNSGGLGGGAFDDSESTPGGADVREGKVVGKKGEHDYNRKEDIS
jgi:hypothetical protein